MADLAARCPGQKPQSQPQLHPRNPGLVRVGLGLGKGGWPPGYGGGGSLQAALGSIPVTWGHWEPPEPLSLALAGPTTPSPTSRPPWAVDPAFAERYAPDKTSTVLTRHSQPATPTPLQNRTSIVQAAAGGGTGGGGGSNGKTPVCHQCHKVIRWVPCSFLVLMPYLSVFLTVAPPSVSPLISAAIAQDKDSVPIWSGGRDLTWVLRF